LVKTLWQPLRKQLVEKGIILELLHWYNSFHSWTHKPA
jgi:hypothetical protein